MTTKFSSISPQNLSEIIEFKNAIKYSNILTENRQKGDFYSYNIFPSLPTLKKLI